ncbi:MAG: PCP reductase family protein [Gemmatimonadetes bacterium]|nr:PCP reductase family protein [Gemmatimonadota bacterium]
MKFLCIPCDRVMEFAERQIPGDGTMAAVFGCPACGREVALLTNPMETQLVSSLGVKVGGRTVPGQPLELVRSSLAEGRADVFAEGDDAAGAGVAWSEEAATRLANVPAFVRGMVKRIYRDYARERGISLITPAVMDQARSDLGLEGM